MITKVTIIGFGTMGRAIGNALKKDKSIKIFIVDIEKKEYAEIKNSDFVILSIKPQNAKEAIEDLKMKGLNKKTILISIMAGVSIEKIHRLSSHQKIVRMMPNLGLSVGYGIAAWKSANLSAGEKKKVKNFIDKITDNFEVKNEDDLNKVTAISGSGPAYFFIFAKYLTEAGKKIGLTKKEVQRLVSKTFSASAILSKETDYSSLVEKVASKGGTTEAALQALEKKQLKKTVQDAVSSAYRRAKELSK